MDEHAPDTPADATRCLAAIAPLAGAELSRLAHDLAAGRGPEPRHVLAGQFLADIVSARDAHLWEKLAPAGHGHE